MWDKIRKASYAVPIIVFLCFIFGMLVMTYKGPVQEAVEGTRFTFGSYIELSDRFEEILQKNIFKKYGFINLNGRMARILKINSLNGVQKLPNGFLTTTFSEKKDVSKSVNSVVELNKFLTERGINFLYIMAPRKNSMYDVQFAPGYGSESRQNMINMVNGLSFSGVKTLDMDEWFRGNGWHMQDIFWKTDSHWKPQAGIAAARCTMELLQQQGIAEYDKEKLEDKNYKIKILKNWFLGRYGKRTGKYYAGVDDIAVYYPKFDVDYYYFGLHRDTTNWSYSKSLLHDRLIKKKDYFDTDPHTIYLYGELPVQIILNEKALNDKRVLVTGTSFRRVWEYFITTQFQEIYSIDLRYYTDGTFAQYVEEIKPDIIIMCVSATSTTGPYYEFGIKEYLEAFKKPLGTVQELGSMKLHAEETNNNKFGVICNNLEPNQTYTLTVDSTDLSGAKNPFVQITLQNLSDNNAIYNRYFDANNNKKQKWIFTTPEKTEDTYGIYLYAGTKGHTANISVNVEGIRLQKGIYEG